MINPNENQMVLGALAAVAGLSRHDELFVSKLAFMPAEALGMRLEWCGGWGDPEPLEFVLWDDEEDVPEDARAEACLRLCKRIMAILHTRPHGRKERNSWEFQASL